MSNLSGSFTGTGQSSSFAMVGRAAVTIEGGIGTVQLERSFDDAVTWVVVSKNSNGDPAVYTTASDMAFNGVIDEPADNILYRFNCTEFMSGTINYRIDQ